MEAGFRVALCLHSPLWACSVPWHRGHPASLSSADEEPPQGRFPFLTSCQRVLRGHRCFPAGTCSARAT